MLSAIIWGTLLLCLFYYWCIKPMSYWKDRSLKQGNPIVLFFSTLIALSKRPAAADNVKRVYNLAPGDRYYGIYEFTIPTLLIRDPDLLKQITVKDFDYFMDHRSFIPEGADSLWEKNLFALTGQKWREMRSILSPGFTSSKMKYMFVLMSECAENYVTHFKKMKQEVVEVEMKDVFSRFANDVIATAAFGIKVDSMAEPNNEFYLMGKAATNSKVFKIIGYIMFPKLMKIFNVKLFDKEATKFFPKVIDETVKLRDEKHIVRPDIIHLLMEARKGVHRQEGNEAMDMGFATATEVIYTTPNSSDGIVKEITNFDIAAQAFAFFFAGFDSVSAIMCFTAYELAVNQDIQSRLRDEINETQKGCKGNLTYEALMKMKYMDMVISECLRKWPSFPTVNRLCTKPYIIEPVNPNEKPVHLEKGVSLWLPIYAIHHDPKYYPEPDRFDPERFNESNTEKITPYTYLPFGLGPRNCIGSRFALMEAKIIFFYILSNFEIIPTEKTIIPLTISKKSFNIASEGGFWLGMKPILQK